jgi:hypothetical protein
MQKGNYTRLTFVNLSRQLQTKKKEKITGAIQYGCLVCPSIEFKKCKKGTNI